MKDSVVFSERQLGSFAKTTGNAVTSVGRLGGKLGSGLFSGLGAGVSAVGSGLGKITSGIGGAVSAITGLGRSSGEAGNQLNSLGLRSNSLAGGITNLGLSAAGAAIHIAKIGIVGATAGAAATGGFVKAAAGFEQARADLIATLAPAERTAENFSQIDKVAKEVGMSTSFSSREAAIGIGEFTQAGLSLKDAFVAIAPAAKAAEVNHTSLANAAEIGSIAMNSFGLKAQNLSHIFDVQTKAAQMGNIAFEDFKLGMAAGGSTAAMAGQSFESFSAALVAVTNGGLSASDAGTSLKTMFTALLNPTDENAALLQKLNVSLTDSQGNFKQVGTVMDEMTVALRGMTPAQRAQTVAQLAGSDAMRAMYLMLKANGTVIDEVTGEMKEGQGQITAWTDELIKSTGSLEEAHKIVRGTFLGALDNLKGSFEELAITIGMQILPVFTKFIQRKTETVNALLEWESKNHTIGNSIASVWYGLMRVEQVSADMWNTFKASITGAWRDSPQIHPLTASVGRFGLALSPAAKAATEFGAKVQRLDDFFSKQKTTVEKTREVYDEFGNKLTGIHPITEKLSDLMYKKVVPAMKEAGETSISWPEYTRKVLTQLVPGFGAVITAASSTAGVMKNLASGATKDFQKLLDLFEKGKQASAKGLDIGKLATTKLPELPTAELKVKTPEFGTKLKQEIEANTQAIQKLYKVSGEFSTATASVTAGMTSISHASYQNSLAFQALGVKGILLQGAFAGLKTMLAGGGVSGAIMSVAAELRGLGIPIDNLIPTLSEAAGSFQDFVNDTIVLGRAVVDGSTAFTNFQGIVSGFPTFLQNVASMGVNFLQSAILGLIPAVGMLAVGFAGGLTPQLNELANGFNKGGATGQAFGRMFQDIQNSALSIGEGLGKTIGGILNLGSALIEVAVQGRLVGTLFSIIGTVFNTLGSVVASFASGVRNNLTTLSAGVQSLGNFLKSAFDGAGQIITFVAGIIASNAGAIGRNFTVIGQIGKAAVDIIIAAFNFLKPVLAGLITIIMGVGSTLTNALSLPLGVLSNVLSVVGPALQWFGDTLSGPVVAGIQKFFDFINGLIDGVKRFGDALGKALKGDFGGAWDSLTKSAGDANVKVGAATSSITKSFNDTGQAANRFGSSINGATSTLGSGSLGTLSTSLDKVGASSDRASQGLVSLSGAGDKVKSSLSTAAQAVEGFKARSEEAGNKSSQASSQMGQLDKAIENMASSGDKGAETWEKYKKSYDALQSGGSLDGVKVTAADLKTLENQLGTINPKTDAYIQAWKKANQTQEENSRVANDNLVNQLLNADAAEQESAAIAILGNSLITTGNAQKNFIGPVNQSTQAAQGFNQALNQNVSAASLSSQQLAQLASLGYSQVGNTVQSEGARIVTISSQQWAQLSDTTRLQLSNLPSVVSQSMGQSAQAAGDGAAKIPTLVSGQLSGLDAATRAELSKVGVAVGDTMDAAGTTASGKASALSQMFTGTLAALPTQTRTALAPTAQAVQEEMGKLIPVSQEQAAKMSDAAVNELIQLGPRAGYAVADVTPATAAELAKVSPAWANQLAQLSTMTATTLGQVPGQAAQAVAPIQGQITSQMQGVNTAAQGVFSQTAGTVQSSMSNVPGAVEQAMAPGQAVMQAQAQSYTTSFTTGLSALPQTVSGSLSQVPDSFNQSMSASLSAVQSGMSAITDATTSGMSMVVAVVTTSSAQIPVGFMQATMLLPAQAALAMGLVQGAILSVNLYGAAQSVGMQVGAGMAAGIAASTGQAVAAAESMAAQVQAASQTALGVHSPSTIFQWIGAMSMEGLALGITDNAGKPVDSMEKVVSTINTASLEAIDKQAEAVSKAASAAGSMLDTLSKLKTYTGPSSDIINAFRGDMTALVSAILESSKSFSKESLEAMGNFLDSAGKVASAASSMADTLLKIKDWSAVGKDGVWAFTQDVFSLVADFYNASKHFDVKMLAAASIFSETAGEVATAAGSMADALSKIKNWSVIGTLSIEAFVNDVWVLTANFYNASTRFSDNMLTATDNFAKTSSSVADAALKSFEILSKLTDYVSAGNANIEAFATDTWVLVANFYNASTRFSDDMLKATDQFADTTSKVGEGGLKAFEVLSKLPEYVSVGAVSIEMFTADLTTLVMQFSLAGAKFTEEMLKASDNFAASGGTAAEAVGKGIEGLSKINEYQGVGSGYIAQFATDMGVLVTQFSLVVVNFKQETTDSVKNFSDSAGSLVDTLGKALETFAGLTNYAGAPQAAIQKLEQDIALAVNLIITLTANLKSQALEQVKAFGDATGSLFDGLKTAMEVFKDLEDFKSVASSKVKELVIDVELAVQEAANLKSTADTKLLAQVSKFGEAVNSLFGGIKSAMDVFKDLNELKDIPIAAMNGLLTSIIQTVQLAANFANLANNDLMAKAQSFMDASNGIFDSIKAAAETIKSLQDYKDGPITGATAVLNSTLTVVTQMAAAVDEARNFNAQSEEYAANLNQAADRIEGAFDRLKNTTSNIGNTGNSAATGDLITGMAVGGSIKGKATGGVVNNDFLAALMGAVLVGENGPELFFPGAQGGYVLNNAMLRSTGLLELFKVNRQLKGRATGGSVGDANSMASLATAYATSAASATTITINTESNDAINSIAEAIQKLLDAISSLSDSIAIPAASLNQFAQNVQQMVAQFANIAASFPSSTLESTSAFSEAAGKVADSMKSSLDLFEQLPSYSRPSYLAIVALATDISQVVEQMTSIAASTDEVLVAKASTFSDNLGKITSGIKNALDLFSSIRSYSSVGSAVIIALSQDATKMTDYMISASSSVQTAALPAAIKFGEAMNSIFGGLKSGVDALTEIRKYRSPDAVTTQAFLTDTIRLVNTALSIAAQGSQTEVTAAADYFTSVTTIFNSLKDALAALRYINAVSNYPVTAITNLAQALSQAVSQMAGLVSTSGQFLDGANSYSSNMLAAASAIQNSTQQVVNSLETASSLPAMPSSVTTRATGGVVGDGIYRVGENGPEYLFMGRSNAYVANNSMSRQMDSGTDSSDSGSYSQNITIIIQGATDPTATGAAVEDRLRRMSKRARLKARLGLTN
jgi:TP901 family phage tail tape measure protein